MNIAFGGLNVSTTAILPTPLIIFGAGFCARSNYNSRDIYTEITETIISLIMPRMCKIGCISLLHCMQLGPIPQRHSCLKLSCRLQRSSLVSASCAAEC